MLKDNKVKIPKISLDKQQSIEQLFSNYEDLIAKRKEAYEITKKLKAGYLYEIFNKKVPHYE